ncbi:MAG: MFS transporter [Opitutus sp.]
MNFRPSPGSVDARKSWLTVAWITVVLLWLAGGSNYMTRTMLTTMRASVIADIHMTDAQFGLLTSSFLWFYALASPAGGFLADRFSRRLVVVGSVFAWSLITVLTAYAATFEHIAVLRALLGLSQAFYIPAAVALIVDFHRGATRALATGIHLTGMICGSTMGGVGGWLAETHSWRYSYLVLGAPGLGLGVLLYFLLRDAPREQLSPSSTPQPAAKISFGEALRSLSRPGPFYLMLGCMAIQGAVSWIIIAWMPTVMREQFKLGQGAAGLSSLGFLYVFQTTGLLSGGFWSDRWSVTNRRARIIIPAVAIMLASPVFLLTGWSPHIGFVFLSLSAYGLAMGFLGANTMPIICLIVDARFRATAMGLLNGCTAITGGLAIYGVGALRDAKVDSSLILMFAGLGVLLCGFLLWRVNVSVRARDGLALRGAEIAV